MRNKERKIELFLKTVIADTDRTRKKLKRDNAPHAMIRYYDGLVDGYKEVQREYES